MKISYIQSDIVWADPEANVARFGAALDSLPKSDLYVLPEMFTTGFATHPEGVAEEHNLGLDWMVCTARERNCAIAGSISTKEGGRFYNRFHFVTPDSVTDYDKHHLFTFSGEHLRYTAGDRRVDAVWQGVRFRLSVCYDLRFPAWLRNNPSEPYDVLVCVASWPQIRSDAWKSLIRARAIENQSYVVAVNREGSDPSCTYSGDSAIIDPYGNVLPNGSELDIPGLEAFRKRFPVLEDADKISL